MNVLITGASRGLGLALVETFLHDGHTVFAGVLLHEKQLLGNIKANYGNKLTVLEMDVTDESAIKKHAKAMQTFTLDVIINNAGIIFGGKNTDDVLQEIDFAELATSMDVNVYGGMRVVKYFTPLLYKSEHGMLLNITSEAGSQEMAAGCYDPYNLSKTMMNIVSTKMKALMKSRNIYVFAIHPGRMKTDMSGGMGDITPQVSARGIVDIAVGKIKITPSEKFVNYLGEPMVY